MSNQPSEESQDPDPSFGEGNQNALDLMEDTFVMGNPVDDERCVICGGPGVSDTYYCKECAVQEKDRDGCPKIVNLGNSIDEGEAVLENPDDDLHFMVNPLLNVKVEFNEKKDVKLLYFCDECGKSFKSKKGYSNHSHDKNRERVKCSECGADFAGPSSLYLHVRNIHGKVKYPCDRCEYKATSKQGLERHVQSLHLKAKFYCEQCDAVLSSRGYLLKHIKAVHDKKKYICDLCPDKEYTFYCSLKKHKDAVHAGVYHMCDICGHKSSTKSHLKTHMKVHRNIITANVPTSAAEVQESVNKNANDEDDQRLDTDSSLSMSLSTSIENK